MGISSTYASFPESLIHADKFTVHKGFVAPMDRENVDTDAIIPKQFLKSIQRRPGSDRTCSTNGAIWIPGYPGQDPASRKPNPDFMLEQASIQAAASILLARKQFWLWIQSREHAPWGAGSVRLPRDHRTQLRRHLFQQQLQERALLPIVLPESASRPSCSMSAYAFPGYSTDRRSGAPGRS